jgi:general secretion pathway protein E
MANVPHAVTEIEGFTESFGERLVKGQKLKKGALERALRAQEETGERLDLILIKLGLVAEKDIAEALAKHLDMHFVTAENFPDEPLLVDKVSVNFLKQARMIPIRDDADGIVLAMADPLDIYAINAMHLATGKPVRPQVATPADIEAALEQLYDQGKSAIQNLYDDISGPDSGTTEDDVERLKDLASEAPVIRLVNLLITRAVEMRASDIHIEPFENLLRVRYRIDGMLQEVKSPFQHLAQAVISRIKIMAKLNIAERRLPQDGRIKVAIRGREIDLRVSTVPSMHGESVVLRILDRGSIALDFTMLGFEAAALKKYRDILERPNGILLVTGPTGSGKTTTLYASLLQVSTPDVKILTVEDPIEYQLEGVIQVQVKPDIGLTFANALRSFLRHDPDIIMIGEIRDLQTAEIAVQSALTGHLVLSTLHTNSAASAVTRLLDMGVDDYLLTSTINGIIAQRLVRTLCRHCLETYRALPEFAEETGLARLAGHKEVTLSRAAGCAQCHGTGYIGRTSIIEIMPMSDSLRRLVLSHADAREIERTAIKEGMRTLYEDGALKALAGETMIEEVLRVTRSV